MLRYKLVMVIALLLAAGLICGSTARAAVVAYWEFNDKAPGSGTTAGERINDSSANNRDAYAGTGTSTPTFVAGNPKFGYTSALHFTAGDDELIFSAGHDFGDGDAVAGTDFNFGPNDSFTIEASIRCPSTNTAIGAIISKIVDVNDPQWWWRIEATGLQRFLVDDDVNEYSVTGYEDVYDGKWHHVAVIRDASGPYKTLYIYVDGVYDWEGADDSIGTLANNADVYIGSFKDTTTREFVGDIDFIKVSSGALYTSEFVQPLSLPSNPSPADDETDVSVDANLSWTAPSGVTVNHYTVYLATDAELNNIVETFTNVTGTSVNPAELLMLTTTYYWRADTNGVDGGVPFERIGDTWSFATPDANQNVLAYWKFDDKGPGGTTVVGERILDSSGNRRDLYAGTGSSTPTYGSGDPNYGSSSTLNLTLDTDEAIYEGAHDFNDGGAIAGSDGIRFDANDSFTMEAVIRCYPINSTVYQGILFKGTDAASSQIWWRIRPTTGYQNFYIMTNTGKICGPIGTINLYDGKWHHLAAVRDTTAHQIRVYVDYLNDVNYADPTTGEIVTPAGLTVGAFANSSTREFLGDIDFIKISRGALTPSQFVQKGIWPHTPIPANGATNVARDTSLSWTSGSGGGLQNIYLYDGDMQLVQSFLNVSDNNVTPSSLLNTGTTYHWNVETASVKGVMWSFTTIPPTASDPVPADDAVNIEPNQVLSWSAGLGALYHRVYLGTDANAVANATTTDPEYQSELPVGTTSFDPDPDLDWDTTYYWRIDENASLPGDVWSFTTYKPQCQLTVADGDFVPDCIIDMKDLGYLVEKWLLSEYETP